MIRWYIRMGTRRIGWTPPVDARATTQWAPRSAVRFRPGGRGSDAIGPRTACAAVVDATVVGEPAGSSPGPTAIPRQYPSSTTMAAFRAWDPTTGKDGRMVEI